MTTVSSMGLSHFELRERINNSNFANWLIGKFTTVNRSSTTTTIESPNDDFINKLIIRLMVACDNAGMNIRKVYDENDIIYNDKHDQVIPHLWNIHLYKTTTKYKNKALCVSHHIILSKNKLRNDIHVHLSME